MLKVGLCGIGFMGRAHLDQYLRLEAEGVPVRVTALCDVDEKKFRGIFFEGNLDVGQAKYDFSRYRIYTDYDEMLEKETLDVVDICLPTDLHPEAAIKALKRGLHVLCEKPMALTTAECERMIAAAKESGRELMIAQCLRFWPHYVLLKEFVDRGTFGAVTGAYFFRGGGTPRWSHRNWMMQRERSGGCILDQHIHDVDLVQWLFGMPEAVSTSARVVIPGSGYDIVSTNYMYPDGKVVNTQGDWTLNGEFGFTMSYRVNFEKGCLVFENGTVRVYPSDGKGYVADVPDGTGHYYEIRYFVESLLEGRPMDIATPESTKETIRLAEAEIASADRGGALVKLS